MRSTALLVLGLCLVSAACSGAKDTYPLILKGEHGSVCIDVELADDQLERAKGLMHRKVLDEGDGMLFIYPSSKPVSFWMKNVPFPLDLIFISDQGIVLNIHQNALPFDETPIYSEHSVTYVLEIQSGLSKREGIAAGDQIDLSYITSELFNDCLNWQSAQ